MLTKTWVWINLKTINGRRRSTLDNSKVTEDGDNFTCYQRYWPKTSTITEDDRNLACYQWSLAEDMYIVQRLTNSDEMNSVKDLWRFSNVSEKFSIYLHQDPLVIIVISKVIVYYSKNYHSRDKYLNPFAPEIFVTCIYIPRTPSGTSALLAVYLVILMSF